jgi:hypothetical protein
MGSRPRKGPGGRSYTPPPKELPAFPGLVRATPKTRRKGGGLRPRWKDTDGNISEWDSQHGTLERYDAKGKHLGEFDPNTGEKLKPADSSREVEL